MPAADITEVKVTFHDERRGQTEYSPPMKKAEVSIFAAVPEGGDGVAALNYVSEIAKAKVKDLLMGSAAPALVQVEEPPLPPTSSDLPASQPDPTTEPPKRTRRTRAQIEADEAAAQAAAGGSTTSGSATDASTASAEETLGQTALSEQSGGGSTDDGDEWAAAAPETVTITDTELNHTCSVTAERVKDPAKVKGVIAKFNPGGDAFDPAKPGGRRFTVNDIPAHQRADFIAQLKALTYFGVKTQWTSTSKA